MKIFGFSGEGSRSTKNSGIGDLDGIDWILEMFLAAKPLEVRLSPIEFMSIVG